jgi:predicted phosphodiesterase
MPKIYSQAFKQHLLHCSEEVRNQNIKSKDARKFVDWHQVKACMIEAFPETENITTESLRYAFIKLTGGPKKLEGVSPVKVKQTVLKDSLVKVLNKKSKISSLAEMFRVSEEHILATLTMLQFEGYPQITLWKEDGVMYAEYKKTLRVESNAPYDYSHLYEGREISFMVLTDTHLGSDKARLDALHWAYDHAASLGIREVYHCGDVTDGFYTNRMTSIREQDAVGFQEQLRLVVDHYPKIEGVTTYFITGNHDATHMRNGFADMGESISMARKDMVYLGHNYAKIYLTESTTMALVHPTDGSANTLSLKLQKLIDNNPKRKADLMFVGHYHKSVRLKYKGSFGYLLPSLQDQTSFMLDNNLVSDVGVTIITLKLNDEGDIIGLHDTYIDLQDMGGVKDAYQKAY